MKKTRAAGYLIIFASLILFIEKTANAATVTVGQYKYPAVIVIPIVSIIISLIILLVLAFRGIKRNRDAITAAINLGVVKKLKADFRAVQSKGRAKKSEKKSENDYIGEINRFKKHLAKLAPEEAFDTLSGITKRFFKELLGLNYEFTYSELVRELKGRGKKKELVDICQRFSDLKYSDRKISKEELAKFADELENILKRERAPKEEGKEKLAVSRVLQQKNRNFFANLIETVKTFTEESRRERARKQKLFAMMIEEEEALKQDMDIAKGIYQKILKSYSKLPPEERKEAQERLAKFYKSINEMLFSTFYSEKSKKQLEYFTSKLGQMNEEAQKVTGGKEEHRHKEIIHKRATKETQEELDELKKLAKIEEEAKERIKSIGEAIVQQAISQESVKHEHQKPHEHKNIIPKPEITHPIIKEARKSEPIPLPEYKKIEEIKPKEIKETVIQLPFQQTEKKERVEQKEKPSEIKSKRLEWLDKETEEIRSKLEKLQKHNYIG